MPAEADYAECGFAGLPRAPQTNAEAEAQSTSRLVPKKAHYPGSKCNPNSRLQMNKQGQEVSYGGNYGAKISEEHRASIFRVQE
jgi:hypothetical protein